MTRIVEYFNGVVAEVLGDGLLVFWNSPDSVADHAAKACETALAQQQAVQFLNQEFAKLKLPQLAIRIGLHTGPVLSGNLGSEMKMKWGCLGDNINLASRLEGLCKFYGVGVICSGATHDALTPNYGFFCRKLDLVQVKGKREATWIYELMGHEPIPCAGQANRGDASRPGFHKTSSTAALDAIHRSTVSLCRTMSSIDCGSEAGCVSTASEEGGWSLLDGVADFITSEQRALKQLYEKALCAYQEARFLAARDLAKALLEEFPGDAPGARLLERVCEYVGPEGEQATVLSEGELAAWTGVSVMMEK